MAGFDNNPFDLDRKSSNGRKYLYNSEDDTWKNLGSVSTYPTVNTDHDGLIYPHLYNKLKQIEELFSNNLVPDLKLTENKNYFYYFLSGDNFVTFTIENNSLRVEANKSAISRRLTKFPCQSKRGIDGPQGATGRDGIDAPTERLRPVYQDGSFDVDVNIPIDSPISIRGFDVDEKVFEAIISLNGSVSDPDNGLSNIEIVENNSDYVRIKGKLNDPKLRFRIRQIGPKGNDGKNGVNYVEVIQNDAPTNGQFTELIGMFRYNPVINSFVFKKTSVNELLNNVINVTPQSNLPFGQYWAAVQVTSDPRKPIEYHKFEKELSSSFLNLPGYTPLSGCYNQVRYSLGYINPSELNSPFTIIGDPFPSLSNCKEPYWFCNNSAGCDAGVDVNPTVVNPPFDTSSSSSSSTSTLSSATSQSSISSITSLSSESLSSESTLSESSISQDPSSDSTIQQSSESSESGTTGEVLGSALGSRIRGSDFPSDIFFAPVVGRVTTSNSTNLKIIQSGAADASLMRVVVVDENTDIVVYSGTPGEIIASSPIINVSAGSYLVHFAYKKDESETVTVSVYETPSTLLFSSSLSTLWIGQLSDFVSDLTGINPLEPIIPNNPIPVGTEFFPSDVTLSSVAELSPFNPGDDAGIVDHPNYFSKASVTITNDIEQLLTNGSPVGTCDWERDFTTSGTMGGSIFEWDITFSNQKITVTDAFNNGSWDSTEIPNDTTTFRVNYELIEPNGYNRIWIEENDDTISESVDGAPSLLERSTSPLVSLNGDGSANEYQPIDRI